PFESTASPWKTSPVFSGVIATQSFLPARAAGVSALADARPVSKAVRPVRGRFSEACPPPATRDPGKHRSATRATTATVRTGFLLKGALASAVQVGCRSGAWILSDGAPIARD